MSQHDTHNDRSVDKDNTDVAKDPHPEEQTCLIDNNQNPTKLTTATNVTPISNKRARRENDEDLLLELIDDLKPEDSSLTLHPFPFAGMTSLLRSEYQPNGIDLRGPNPKSPTRRSRHDISCDSCKCEKELCHDTRFGLYCGLRVAELIQEVGAGKLFGETISKLMKQAYNEVLRVETVQQIGVLDTFNDYDPPQCMVDKSMKNIMRHFLYQKFTNKMNKRLEDGSRGNRGSGSYGFYTALRVEEDIEIRARAKNDSK